MQTVSAVQSFFLAMALYPEVQKKAQMEIDAVTGNNRLPSFSDRDALPYTNAIVKEAMRWQPVTPLGTCTLFIHASLSAADRPYSRCSYVYCGRRI